MPVKKFNTRIKNKIDVSGSLQNFIPLEGEIVIGGPADSQTGNLKLNEQANPYIAKIGDGTSSWEQLPCLGNDTLIGENGTLTDLGNGLGQISVSLPEGNKKYTIVNVPNSAGIDTLNLVFTGTTPLLSEHYVMIQNSGTSDIYLNSVTATFNNSSAVVNTRREYITPGDICEIQAKVFMIGGTYYVSAIPQLGIMQTISTSGDETTWQVNSY